MASGSVAAKAGGARVLNDLSQLGSWTPAPTPAKPATPRPGAVGAKPAASVPARLGEAELASLVPARFLDGLTFERLNQLPRYLKALATRLERAGVNPLKDRERAAQLQPYLEALRNLANGGKTPERRAEWETLRWMIEEYRVSLFAQELGTAMPVSPKRLDEQVSRVRGLA